MFLTPVASFAEKAKIWNLGFNTYEIKANVANQFQLFVTFIFSKGSLVDQYSDLELLTVSNSGIDPELVKEKLKYSGYCEITSTLELEKLHNSNITIPGFKLETPFYMSAFEDWHTEMSDQANAAGEYVVKNHWAFRYLINASKKGHPIINLQVNGKAVMLSPYSLTCFKEASDLSVGLSSDEMDIDKMIQESLGTSLILE